MSLKRSSVFVFLLAVFALISGYLLSAISLAGRTGINLFYTQYKFLKDWWKGALLVFVVWVILLAIQLYVHKKASKSASIIVQAALLIIALAGLYMSYSDFRNSLSHRWLGERFHLGVYLFWLGWIAISVFMLLQKKIGRIEDGGKEEIS
ncbi:cytochrome d ubiquinol oxidase subunit II [Segetibacter sp.]|jgi:hypothetical protein|uniref:cytochrome d ubiquinol oxidase subunit II n=1 Tax=Segetibacter sp. TaxID=2231182 RepID=UPI00262AE208|nr:cytochrome d ubiquinol oxidase subunit II [Segetibacter sp.]MCW3079324.1 hypothetical protein [Segetibacter sp.]